MKIVAIIDSFKGSMTSLEGGFAALDGIKRVVPDAEVIVKPISDGGEGLVDSLTEGMGGRYEFVKVKNPLGEEITAKYGIAGNTAIIEMSAAAGIFLIPVESLNPMVTTTYGVGEMIIDAINKGCRNFIIGIGGSATNDAGLGMLEALGFEFFDENNKKVPWGAIAPGKVNKIVTSNVIPDLYECTFNIACDVDNPLCGERGCSAVYGPQKGAKKEDIPVMDDAMRHFGEVTKMYNSKADMMYPGAGAAGGMGFAFLSYLNGKLKSGIELVLEQIEAEKFIKDADLVITGEGKMDFQTVMGKVPVGVAKLAKKHGKTVIAFAGGVTHDAVECNKHGIDAFFPIVRTPCTLEDAMKVENAKNNMSDSVEQAIRLWMAGRNE